MNFSLTIISLLVFASVKNGAPEWATCTHTEKVFGKLPANWHCSNDGKTLGSGSAGITYLLTDTAGEKVICKVMDFQDPESMAQAKTEYDVLKTVSGLPNIIRFIDGRVVTVKPKGKVLMILQEYAENGTLESFFDKRPELFEDPRFTMKIMAGIANGVKNMHMKSYVHADLKLGNIVIDGRLSPKLIDFDLSNKINESGDFKGSPAYADPRIMFQKLKVYDEKVDVYSLGVIMYKLITKKLPFQALTVDGVRRVLNEGNFRIPDNTERSVAIIIGKCLQREEQNRPTMDQLIKMIDDYLSSATDHKIKEIVLNNNVVPTEAQFQIIAAVGRGASRNVNLSRRGHRALLRADGDKVGDGEATQEDRFFIGLLCATVGLLLFLGSRLIARWFDSVRNETQLPKIDATLDLTLAPDQSPAPQSNGQLDQPLR